MAVYLGSRFIFAPREDRHPDDVPELICRAAWLRARAQIDRATGVDNLKAPRVVRRPQWKEVPRVAGIDDFLKKERAIAESLASTLKVVEQLVGEALGPLASGRVRVQPLSGGNRADMVIEDEAGNAVEEVEVQVTRRPAGMAPVTSQP